MGGLWNVQRGRVFCEKEEGDRMVEGAGGERAVVWGREMRKDRKC